MGMNSCAQPLVAWKAWMRESRSLETGPGLSTSGKPISHRTQSKARGELGVYFMLCVTKPWRASYFPTDVSGVV